MAGIELDAVCKAEYASVLKTTIFNTFKRQDPIRIYFLPERVVAIHDPNFDGSWDYGAEKLSSFNYTPRYRDIYCRIWYIEDNTDLAKALDLNPDFKIKQNIGKIKIQTETLADLQDILQAHQIEVLGEKYTLDSDYKKFGLFDTFQVFEITIVRVS